MLLLEKAYRNPGISRDSLIEQPGTNKKLFSEAFRECFHTSFTEYINRFRPLEFGASIQKQPD
jgi:AraC-like DNA-binding protein